MFSVGLIGALPERHPILKPDRIQSRKFFHRFRSAPRLLDYFAAEASSYSSVPYDYRTIFLFIFFPFLHFPFVLRKHPGGTPGCRPSRLQVLNALSSSSYPAEARPGGPLMTNPKVADLAGPGIGNYEDLEKILPSDYNSALTR